MLELPVPLSDLQLLRQVIESSAVGTVLTDALQGDQPIVYVNPAFERLSGYPAAELLGRNCRILQSHDRDQPGVREIRRAIEQQQSVTVTLRNYRRDGTLLYNELTLSPVRSTAGTVTHFVGFQNDVTAREESRLDEAKLHGQLTSTLARMTDGFVSLDQDLNFIYLNAAAARISGRLPGDLTGHNLLTTFPELADTAVLQAIGWARETGTVQSAVSSLEPFGTIEVTAYPAEDGISVFTRDVTEYHQMQEERQASEERFASVVEAAPMAMVVARVSDHHYVDVNPEFLRQSGYSREEVIGHTPLDLKFWVDPLEFEDVGHILRERGKVLNHEVQFRLKSGMVADAVVSVVPVTLGGEACLLTLVRDITTEKRARQQLEESEARYRQIAAELQRTLDLSQDMITTIGPDATVISVNAACERLLGHTPEELIGRSLLELVHPDDLIATHAEGAGMMQKGRAEQQGATVYQNRYLHKDGRTVWLEWNAMVIPDHRQIYCVARDITGRKAAEEDQAFLAAIVQASHAAVVGVGLDGTIRSWNTGAERLYGYTAAEAIGQPLTLVTPPELHAESLATFKKVTQGERIEPFETVRTARDGHRIPVSMTVSPVIDAAGRMLGVATVARDISARLTADREIQTLNTGLRQQLRHITGLRAIDQSIAASANLNLTLSLVVDHLCEQLGVDAASTLVLNPDTLALEYTALRGFSPANLQSTGVKVGFALAGQVALSGQPLHVPDLSTVRFSPDEQNLLQHDGFTSSSYYAVPLITKGKVVGVIEVLHRQALPLSPLWLELLGTLASQAAIAVENVQLFTELERKNLELRLAYDETIECWARALDLRDEETEGHSRRVTEMTVALCQQLGVSSEKLVNVRRGALLHDIGKMGVPDAILLKPGKLTDEEWVEMRKHPRHAVELLSPIRFLRSALDIPEYHHEKWDGSGYPLGLKGEVIPLTARAFAVVDVYDALTSDRPYRMAWTRERALEHIQASAGSHFDPHVVQVFLTLLESSASGQLRQASGAQTRWKAND